MKIAFVYDRINKFGGAERVLLALREIWPDAPLFTAVYDREKASWAKVFNIKTSFLNHFPLSSSKHEIFPTVTPFVFETFDFDKYDVVLSITSADAKSIITKPETLHICYCLTPVRYLWSGYQDYLSEPGVGVLKSVSRLMMKAIFKSLRHWDYIASSRPDKYIAISKTVANRIEVYYKKKTEVIYPPVDINVFRLPTFDNTKNESYYLIVARLVPYKRIDYVISAFNKLGWKLKIIGTGIDEKRLKQIALKNIEFITDNLTDEKLCCYYQNCKAFIFPGEEDFGITAVEAQACGKPVVCLGYGGVSEIVIPGKTGEVYFSPSEEDLIYALKKFSRRKYSLTSCRTNAIRFSKMRFQKEIQKKVLNFWREWRTN